MPAVIETRIDNTATAWKGDSDVSRWYVRPSDMKMLDATVPRVDLWAAAVKLTMSSPLFGWGPDNFRLLYGWELGADSWDTNIRSNSLYLELLTGSGLIGAAAFISMIFFVRWTPGPASLSAAVFLVHGLVDVLLMTTPVYFGFWMLMGLAHENRV
jgi:O-antigen ligase